MKNAKLMAGVLLTCLAVIGMLAMYIEELATGRFSYVGGMVTAMMLLVGIATTLTVKVQR